MIIAYAVPIVGLVAIIAVLVWIQRDHPFSLKHSAKDVGDDVIIAATVAASVADSDSVGDDRPDDAT